MAEPPRTPTRSLPAIPTNTGLLEALVLKLSTYIHIHTLVYKDINIDIDLDIDTEPDANKNTDTHIDRDRDRDGDRDRYSDTHRKRYRCTPIYIHSIYIYIHIHIYVYMYNEVLGSPQSRRGGPFGLGSTLGVESGLAVEEQHLTQGWELSERSIPGHLQVGSLYWVIWGLKVLLVVLLGLDRDFLGSFL